MASACVNNIASENYLDCPVTVPSYSWLSHRLSASGGDSPKFAVETPAAETFLAATEPSDPDVSGKEAAGDFEFMLDDPVTMLPADELFSDGKLVPLQISTARSATPVPSSSEVRPAAPERPKAVRIWQASDVDPHSSFSPRAPTCSIRWKNILRLKKLQVNSKTNHHKTTASLPSPSSRSLISILNRSSKSSNPRPFSLDIPSPNLPLLKESDSESVSTSSRLSLSSSSSSGHDHDDLPKVPILPSSDKPGRNTGAPSETRTVLADSPRLNPSGKVVFQGLERSSSSPGSFNGGPRHKHGRMERSYSAHVRVTPVLNVPVCSLRGTSKFGFPLFSSSQKRDCGNGGGSRIQRRYSKNNNRTDQAW